MQSSWRKSALSLSSSFSSFSEQVHRLLFQSFFQRSSSHIFVCIVYFLAFFLTYLSNSPRHTYKLSSHRKMPTIFLQSNVVVQCSQRRWLHKSIHYYFFAIIIIHTSLSSPAILFFPLFYPTFTPSLQKTKSTQGKMHYYA